MSLALTGISLMIAPLAGMATDSCYGDECDSAEPLLFFGILLCMASVVLAVAGGAMLMVSKKATVRRMGVVLMFAPVVLGWALIFTGAAMIP